MPDRGLIIFDLSHLVSLEAVCASDIVDAVVLHVCLCLPCVVEKRFVPSVVIWKAAGGTADSSL